jgi:predicted MPP superfamily phosphohydrolase
VFTAGPDRLSGGRVSRRHTATDFALREVETASPLWPEAFDGLRIGHVSDFHVGGLITVERALEAIDLLAAQEPDFVACTGDVVDLHHHDAPPVLRALAEIDAPLGSALVLGNHDELHCPETIRQAAADAGLLVLDDEAAWITRNGERLLVGGVSWAKTVVQCGKRVRAVCGKGVDVLLAHNPKAFSRAARLRVPLTLSGHTHGGQIAVRNRPNVNLALSHRHRAGLFERGPSRLFVTAGVGSWFPLRVNCPPEVAVITMRHDPDGEPARRSGNGRRRRSRRSDG